MQRISGRLILAVLPGLCYAFAPSAMAGPLAWQGVASCATSACHGGNGPRGSRGSEYTTWVQYDAHARAYTTLNEERSRRITDKLRAPSAEKNDQCLACHVHPGATAAHEEARPRLADGVGCENCHGPAESWRTPHTRPDWKEKSRDEKTALGLRPLRDLRTRAKACVPCHVGSAGADVNHDLIAAGHPRLNFEFAVYFSLFPRHWEEKDWRADLEAQAWAVGQGVSAQAALELLKARADAVSSSQQAKPDAGRAVATAPVWPEFAEYECFACHHEWRDPSWRQQRGYAGRVPGALPWGSWYLAQARPLLRRPGMPDAGPVEMHISRLERLMESPAPDPAPVARAAGQAAGELEAWLRSLQGRPLGKESARRLLTSLIREGLETPPTGWDAAAQLDLALVPLYRTFREPDAHARNPRIEAALRGLTDALAFPRGYDSAHGFDPAAFRTPLQRLRQELGP